MQYVQQTFQKAVSFNYGASRPIFSIFAQLSMQDKKIFALLFGLFLSTFGYSQVDNRFFTRVDSTAFDAGSKWQLQVDQLSFARNSEYRSRITRGRTLMGFQLESNVRYRINENAYVKGGLWLKRDFGTEGFHQVLPLFALHYRKKNTEFVFGNLMGTTDHQLIEPILDPQRIIDDRIENGLQIIHRGKELYADVWVDWQQMIYEGSPFQERFVAGYNANLIIAQKKTFTWKIHSQTTAFHRGGEIDASVGHNVSLYNFNHGTQLLFEPENSILKELDFRLDFTNYEDESTFVEDTYLDGVGQLVSVRANFKPIQVMAQYWDSHQYQSPEGDRIYHSVSRINPHRHNANYRKMLMFRAAYEQSLGDNLNFLFRTQFMYDVHKKSQDVIVELYLRWKLNQNLGKTDAS